MVGKGEQISLSNKSWTCTHCNEKIGGNSLTKTADQYGVIFLYGINDGYFGIICPNCFRTFLCKLEMNSLINIKNELFYNDITQGHSVDFPKFHYHPFPYSFSKNLIIKRSNIWEYSDTLHENEQWHGITENDYLPERYYSYYSNDFAFKPAIVLWAFDENDIQTLIDIENETRLKIFPRYIVYDPLYTAIENFCWIYHLRLDFYNNIDLPIPTVDLFTDSSKYRLTKNYEFLQILDIVHERDLYDSNKPVSQRVITSGEISRLPRSSDIQKTKSSNKNKVVKPKRPYADVCEKVWANFNKDYVQSLLSQMAIEFIDKYIELTQKTLFDYDSVWTLKQSYLEKLYDSIESRSKREQAKKETADYIRNKVQEAEKHFPGVDIISNNDEINDIKRKIPQFSNLKKDVYSMLILGEKGTGKGSIAQAIYEASKKEKGSLVKVDCSTKNELLFEDKLFGHIKGAFTGADNTVSGAFEEAGDGVVFFDEVGNLTPRLQEILLNPLQDRKYPPVGSSKTKDIHARFLFATNANLAEMVEDGKFRGDLYDRINIIPITIPPLRKRKIDIPLLFEHFIKKYDAARETNEILEQIKVTDECMSVLKKYDWPGNVRELENEVIRIMGDRSMSGDRSAIASYDLKKECFGTTDTSIKLKKKPIGKSRRKLPEMEEVSRLVDEEKMRIVDVARLYGVSRSHVSREYNKYIKLKNKVP